MKTFLSSITFFLLMLTCLSSAQTNFWEPTTGPINVSSLSIDSTTGYIFAGTSGDGIYGSGDNGDNWTQIGFANMDVNLITINSSGHIFLQANPLGWNNGSVYRSTDNGANWTETSLTEKRIGSLAINSYDYVYAGTDSGVYYSTDNGDIWSHIAFVDTFSSPIAFNSNDHIFVGTGYDGVFRSTDNGNSWTQTGLVDTAISSFAVNSNDHIFVGSAMGGAVFRSTDNGNLWIQTSLNNTDINFLAINSLDHVFAGSFSGVYRSINNGDTWTQINSGLTNHDVGSLAINPDGYIFAGIWNEGIYRSTQSTITNINETDQVIHSLVLKQNYPNPFNPNTTIEFSLPKTEFITLKIYNTLGQEVATLISKKMTPGNHKYTWDASTFASGVYYYRVEAGEYVKIKKLILLR